MPSTYEQRLRIELQATGENPVTWGAKENNNSQLFSDSIAGLTTVDLAGSGTRTLSVLQGTADESRVAILRFTGTLTGDRTVVIPSVSKVYILQNNTSGDFAVDVKTASGAAFRIPQGGRAQIFCDGADCYGASNAAGLSLVPATRSVIANATTGSIVGGGALDTNRTLTLENDAATPGYARTYATDKDGARGWQLAPYTYLGQYSFGGTSNCTIPFPTGFTFFTG